MCNGQVASRRPYYFSELIKTVCGAEALSGAASYVLLCNTTKFRNPSTPTVDRPMRDTSLQLELVTILSLKFADQKRVQHRKADSRDHLLIRYTSLPSKVVAVENNVTA